MIHVPEIQLDELKRIAAELKCAHSDRFAQQIKVEHTALFTAGEPPPYCDKDKEFSELLDYARVYVDKAIAWANKLNLDLLEKETRELEDRR